MSEKRSTIYPYVDESGDVTYVKLSSVKVHHYIQPDGSKPVFVGVDDGGYFVSVKIIHRKEK